MTLSSLFEYINIHQIIILLLALIICVILFRLRKKATAEETLQAIQLTCNMAQEMRDILTNAYLINEMLNKAELSFLKDKKILSFNTAEYEDLCQMLDSIMVVGAHGVKTVDRIILLLRSC